MPMLYRIFPHSCTCKSDGAQVMTCAPSTANIKKLNWRGFQLHGCLLFRGRIDARGSSVSQCFLISHVVLCGMSMAK